MFKGSILSDYDQIMWKQKILIKLIIVNSDSVMC